MASLLEGRGYEVAGRAGDVTELMAIVREHEPDVVVVDIRMPPTHTTEGLDAALAMRREFPQIGVLVLSAHAEVEQAMELMGGGGGVGYLLKSRVMHVDEFLDALELRVPHRLTEQVEVTVYYVVSMRVTLPVG